MTFTKGHKHSEETKQKIKKSKLGKTGKENNNWKGGQYKETDGYIMVYKPNHPFCNSHKYVQRARLIMEKHLRRYLKPEEVTHHINSIKDDDRIENIYLFANNGLHSSFHNKLLFRKRKRNKKGQFI